MAGGGIARLGDILAAEAIREGHLVPLLRDWYVAERIPLQAVYPQGRHRMPKVRAFIEFLSGTVRACAVAIPAVTEPR